MGDGLFLRCCEEVAELYPKITFDTMIIDNCCMQVRTADMGGYATSDDFTQAVIAALAD
ncbi:hypothetical protein E2320_007370 [Naja naja]|nr:hypothetical protein E2320_007370 [Naja naja]